MQAVAAELNLAETAFVVPRRNAEREYDLRWFTPTTEVSLCGHATLATTHTLGLLDEEVRFHTKSGVLTCRLGSDGWISMDFPATAVVADEDPPDWASPLGLPADRVVDVLVGGEWVVVELVTPADVRAAVPDREAIVERGGSVIVVATPGDRDGIDSVARVFVPGFGIDEDPVTGAAHCVIGPWLAARTGRRDFTGEQASRRGGSVGMHVSDDGSRVILRGRAVTILDADLRTPPPTL